MFVVLTVLLLVVCVFLILIVLVQNPKGGGLSSSFGQGNSVMGVRKTTDFLEKATWTLAIALLALSLFAGIMISDNNKDEKVQQEQVEQNDVDAEQPVAGEGQETPVE